MAAASPARLSWAGDAASLCPFTAVGIVSSLGRSAVMKAAGADFVTLAVGDILVPDRDGAEFARRLEILRAAEIPLWGVNLFLRGTDRCTGPETNHEEIVAWAGIVCARLAAAGGRFVVFGSGRARRVPEGWPLQRAREQFAGLLRRLGPLAGEQGVKILVEQLRAEEDNLINRIGDLAGLIRAVDQPPVRALADLYHLRAMGEGPADLAAALDVVDHLEIAELEQRSFPGVHGDDFRPYFRVLREAGWQGGINIEATGEDARAAEGLRVIREQAAG